MSRFRPEDLLGLVRTPVADDHRPQLLTFLRFLLLHLAVRDWIRLLDHGGESILVTACILTAAAVLSWFGRLQDLARRCALVTVYFKLSTVFPHNSNHFYIEVLCVTVLNLVRLQSVEEARHGLVTLRWFAVLIFFHSGLQKVFYGTYFQGAFLASFLKAKAFAEVWERVLPAEEFRRLWATAPPGPFRFESLSGLIASNGVYIGEVAAAVLLLIPRLVSVGVVSALLLVLGIELGAREFMFGGLITNLTLLFCPPRWSRLGLGLALPFYGVLLCMQLGWIPGGDFN